jgi:pyroglutamyl-peptidase
MGRPRLLLTGFGPFAGLPLNPSEQVVRHFEGEGFDAAELVCRVLPISYRAVPDALRSLVAEHRPHAALSLGVAIGTPVIRVETTALNRADFKVADNDGLLARETPDGAGPAARVATYPADDIARAIRAAGVPASVSHHAGTHLCNLTLYTLLGALGSEAPCGFLHLPLLPAQVAAMMEAGAGRPQTAPFAPTDLPSMALETQVRATEAALRRLAETLPKA